MQRVSYFIILFILFSCSDQIVEPENDNASVSNNSNITEDKDEIRLANGMVMIDFIYCDEFMNGEWNGSETLMSEDVKIKFVSNYDTAWSFKKNDGHLAVNDLKVHYGFYLLDTIDYSIYYKNRYYHSDTFSNVGLLDYYPFYPPYAILEVSTTKIEEVSVKSALDSLGRFVKRFNVKALGNNSDAINTSRGALIFISNNEIPNEQNALFTKHYLVHHSLARGIEHNGYIDIPVSELRKVFGINEEIYFSIHGASGDGFGNISSYDNVSIIEEKPSLIYPNLSESVIRGSFVLTE